MFPIGFTLVIFIFSTIRERLLKVQKTPAPFVGNPIALIVAGFNGAGIQRISGVRFKDVKCGFAFCGF